MKFKVLAVPPFNRQFKRLAKRYASFKKDISELIESLAQNPQQGTPIGSDCYKVRLAITSKGKGQAGGARVITYLHTPRYTVYLLAVYDKFDQKNLLDKELEERLHLIPK